MHLKLVFFNCLCLATALSLACEDTARNVVDVGGNGTGLATDETNTQDGGTSTSNNPGTEESTWGSDTPSESDICGGEAFGIEHVPTRLMIVQDLSSSMDEANGGGTRWQQARAALKTLLGNPSNAAIEFGFDMFPIIEDPSCKVGTSVLFDAELGSAGAISDGLDQLQPNKGGTPLCQALRNFDPEVVPGYAPDFMATGAQTFLLLVSDGNDTCGGAAEGDVCGDPNVGGSVNPERLAERAKALADAGVGTFVIGFQVGSGNSQLNAIASNGGTSLDTYINVKNQAELQAALDGIAATVVPCSFDLNPPDNADPDKVNFKLDGVIVPRDDDCSTGNGWHWADDEHTRAELCPDTCADFQGGQGAEITAEYGCPTEVVV